MAPVFCCWKRKGTIETCCSTCLRALLRYSLGKSNHIRRFQSVPQPSLDGRTIEMIQGNVIGGGSSINALAYTRGVRADYDAWHRSVGGAGWGWEDLLPYFTRQEGNSTLGAPAHGIVGPLDAMLKAFDGRTRVRDSVMGRCVVRSIKSLLNR